MALVVSDDCGDRIEPWPFAMYPLEVNSDSHDGFEPQ